MRYEAVQRHEAVRQWHVRYKAVRWHGGGRAKGHDVTGMRECETHGRYQKLGQDSWALVASDVGRRQQVQVCGCRYSGLRTWESEGGERDPFEQGMGSATTKRAVQSVPHSV